VIAVLDLEVAPAQGVGDVDKDLVRLEGLDDVALSPDVPLLGSKHYLSEVTGASRARTQ
jgi:hypothetical protein